MMHRLSKKGSHHGNININSTTSEISIEDSDEQCDNCHQIVTSNSLSQTALNMRITDKNSLQSVNSISCNCTARRGSPLNEKTGVNILPKESSPTLHQEPSQTLLQDSSRTLPQDSSHTLPQESSHTLFQELAHYQIIEESPPQHTHSTPEHGIYRQVQDKELEGLLRYGHNMRQVEEEGYQVFEDCQPLGKFLEDQMPEYFEQYKLPDKDLKRFIVMDIVHPCLTKTICFTKR